MVYKNLSFTVLFLVLALLLIGCEVEEKQEGKMPEVDMDVKTEPGQMPEYDVDTADVDVGTEEKQIEVPEVEVEKEEKTITVPDVEVTMPDEKRNESEQ